MNQPPNGQGYPGDGQQPGQPWQQPQQQYPQQQQAYPQQQQGYPQPPPKKSNNSVILAAAGIGLFAALGVGAIAYVATQKDTGVTEAAGTSSTVAGEAGSPLVTEIPGKSTTPTSVNRVTPQTAPKPKPVPKPVSTTAVGATTQAGSPTTASDPCGAGVGSSVNGIATGDPFVIAKVDTPGGERRFDIVLDAGDTIEINVFQVDFDPMVEVLDSNGNSVAFNDDGPFGLDSQVTFTVGTGGVHSVFVFSAVPSLCGLFEIDAAVVSTGSGSGGSGGGAALSPPSTNSFFVSLSSTVTRIEVDAVVGDTVIIFVVDGEGTDPLISMITPTGAPWGSDDNGAAGTEGPRDSRIEFVAAESGTYEGFIESTNGVDGNAQVIILIN